MAVTVIPSSLNFQARLMYVLFHGINQKYMMLKYALSRNMRVIESCSANKVACKSYKGILQISSGMNGLFGPN